MGAFFSTNLFVGVVVDNFNRLKRGVCLCVCLPCAGVCIDGAALAEFDGSAFLTTEQRQWVATQRLIRSGAYQASLAA